MERVMTVPEAADLLRQSVYTVRNWIREGKLRAKKIGRGYLITEDAIRELVTPTLRPKLSREDSFKLMRELQEEGRQMGIGPDTFKKAMERLEERERESREEIRRMFGGGGS